MEKMQRLVFGETLAELGAEDPRVVVLDADVSSSTQTRLFALKYPDRFFNFGIAEANMVSAAAGMATYGCVPVVSTFALFLSLRAGDQVRAQVAYPALNVKLVGNYAGLSDFADGASHQSVEDMAITRAIPNMTVIAPSDIAETRLAVRAAVAHDGPVFLRISREAVSDDYGPDHPFAIGKGVVLRDGRDVTLIATGTVVKLASTAADALAKQGISARVVDMHTIKPLDTDLVTRAAVDTGAIVTVEEHSVIGGLGAAVCETVCATHPVPVVRVGIPDRFGESGAYQEILRRAGIDTAAIVLSAKQAITLKA
ncbi:MAG: transketolase [Verrucomicrobia bacterium]|nr:transketolase [Verrucomicrobiota bacterium]